MAGFKDESPKSEGSKQRLYPRCGLGDHIASVLPCPMGWLGASPHPLSRGGNMDPPSLSGKSVNHAEEEQTGSTCRMEERDGCHPGKVKSATS